MRKQSSLLIGAVAVVALAGCSTSTSAPSESPATPAATSPSAPASPTTTDVLPPIVVDGSSEGINATVGDVLDITVPNVTKVSTDNSQILEVTQPRDDGSATFNASATVLSAGTATLTIEKPGGPMKITVHVTE